MNKVRLFVLALCLFVVANCSALEPTTITLLWDYELAANVGVTGFRVYAVVPDGSKVTLGDIPLPSPLPTPDANGFSTFSKDVSPTRTGNLTFEVIAITSDSAISSDSSAPLSLIVKPDKPVKVRKQ